MERIWNKHKQINTTLKPKVFVAMSGGVDSSVAAALLKKQGFGVVGVFFKPWQPNPTVNCQLSTVNFCQWEQDRLDAMKVAARLGIEFKTWDFSKEYGKFVAKYMIDGYRAGITPNPDVMCNKEIKFGLFLKKALAEGADYIATGHYARLAVSIERLASRARNKKLNAKRYTLYAGIDKNKDQSYFLWTLTQEQLKHCLFPIGNYTKPEVRKLAKKFGLPNYDKKDSQGVCFVGRLDMKDFLKNYIKPKRGEIRLFALYDDRHTMRTGQKKDSFKGGKILGYHDGAYYYTIGQRHGLDIKDGRGPYFVAHKDVRKNIIYVTNAQQSSKFKILKIQSSKVKKINWINDEPKLPINCQVKIRYRSKSIPATISRLNLEMGKLTIKFKKPARAVTPGQSAVFYRGQEVLGGGIIS